MISRESLWSYCTLKQNSHGSTQNNMTLKILYIFWINHNPNHLLELYSPSFEDIRATNVILLNLTRIPTGRDFCVYSLIIIKIKKKKIRCFSTCKRLELLTLILQVLPLTVPFKYVPIISLQPSPNCTLSLKCSRNP